MQAYPVLAQVHSARLLRGGKTRLITCALMMLTVLMALPPTVAAQAYSTATTNKEDSERPPDAEPAPQLTPDELQTLIAPIALYSDELLAIVLPASTYPLQIVAANRYRAAMATQPDLEPDEYWDASVVALLNYPEALTLLDQDLRWTWALGEAVANQQGDVLAAVAAYRTAAHAAGNLKSDDKHAVQVDDTTVTIRSADPEVIYVPYYDPVAATTYQTERVYHYYPSAYPVYYYPYTARHRFYDDGFWGINSAFVLSWQGLFLSHHHYNHHAHPYFGRRYHQNHFRHTQRYTNRHGRRDHDRHQRPHRSDRNRRHERWQPDRRWAGSRPRQARPVRSDGPRMHTLRRQTTPETLRAHQQRRAIDEQNVVHRSLRREINSLTHDGERSSIHRPIRRAATSTSAQRHSRPSRERVNRASRPAGGVAQQRSQRNNAPSTARAERSPRQTINTPNSRRVLDTARRQQTPTTAMQNRQRASSSISRAVERRPHQTRLNGGPRSRPHNPPSHRAQRQQRQQRQARLNVETPTRQQPPQRRR